MASRSSLSHLYSIRDAIDTRLSLQDLSLILVPNMVETRSMTPARKKATRSTNATSASKRKVVKPRSTNRESTGSSGETEKGTFEYEFCGPIGTGATTVALPIVILLLVHWSDVGRLDFSFLSETPESSTATFLTRLQQSHVFCPGCTSVDILLSCTLCLLGWFLFLVVLERFLPCELVQGKPIKGNPANGTLTYRINGHLSFWITFLVLVCAWPYWDGKHGMLQFAGFPYLSYIYQYHAELAFCTIILCFLLSVFLYLNSFRKDHDGNDKILADGGDSGNVIYDFFIGRELNPRIGKSNESSFDWKVFCELRPGLIGWMILNISCLNQQRAELGYVSGSMLLLNVFQGLYVWDALYQERCILTTMDVTTDGFGFMLIFGDLAWVPFTYSVQARYLVKHDPHLGLPALAAILAFYMLGFAIFRRANSQKDAFRRDPNHPALSHLTFLQTKRGTKLLTSGWWGMARKINYTGDYIIGLTWCLLCGFDSIVPYYYAVYFFILLIHRSIRDDHMCQNKYGEDWQRYKELVPYRFIPGLV